MFSVSAAADRMVLLRSRDFFCITIDGLTALVTFRSILARWTVVCTLLGFLRLLVETELLMRDCEVVFDSEARSAELFCALMNLLACYCSYCVDILFSLYEEPCTICCSSRCLLSDMARSSLGYSIIVFCDWFLFRLLELLRVSKPPVPLLDCYYYYAAFRFEDEVRLLVAK